MKKILLTILLILICGVSVVACYHKDNILAIVNGTKYSSEELKSQLDENKDKLKEEVKKYTQADIQDISAEDEKKLLTGEITLQEIAQKYNLPMDVVSNGIKPSTGANSGSNSNNTNISNNNSSTIDNEIADAVSQMYALKAFYVSKLGELEKKVISEYTSLPAEKQNDDSKKEIVLKNLDYVAQIEKSCDSEVSYVLANLESQLNSLNGDTEIINILQNAYEEEKEIKKSYYLSLYYN